jgi:hypothetical protein
MTNLIYEPCLLFLRVFGIPRILGSSQRLLRGVVHDVDVDAAAAELAVGDGQRPAAGEWIEPSVASPR